MFLVDIQEKEYKQFNIDIKCVWHDKKNLI